MSSIRDNQKREWRLHERVTKVSTTDMVMPIAAYPYDLLLLYEKTSNPHPVWRNFILVNLYAGIDILPDMPPATQKHAWHLGWNGKRLAKTKDAILLAREWPDIEEWVISVLKRRISPPAIF
jgi:hypothetical protein